MAEFDSRERIAGLVCTTRALGGLTDRLYEVVFKREDATIDQLEEISWKRPPVNDYCKLPIGFAFNLKSITYNTYAKAYVVTLIVRDQYLGDVTRYQEEIANKDETIATMTSDHAAAIAAKDATINDLNGQLADADETIIAMSDQLAEADEAMMQLYEQMMASEETEEDTGLADDSDAE